MPFQKYCRLLILCLLFLSHPLSSQIIFQGTVTDNGAEYLGNGAEPVIHAAVILTDQTDANRSFIAVTDELGHFSIEVITTGISEDHPALPGGFRLHQNYPNPFNPSTVIRYELAWPSPVRIEVYNLCGQKVKTLIDGFQNGPGQVIWDATDDQGRGVPSGLYICSLQAGDHRANRKMLLIDGHYGPIEAESLASQGSIQNGNPVLTKSLSGLYRLEVTGDDIAPKVQQNIEITEDMTVDVTVIRTVTDIDGNNYQTVKIGDQWWTSENLKVIHYRNGDAISYTAEKAEWANASTGAYCPYDNNESYADIYGYLYNWFAVEDSRGLAPEGWHVPTDAEWRQMEMYLGISRSDANQFGTRGGDEGGKLKMADTLLWEYPNLGATNESGFSGLPNGHRGIDGVFYNLSSGASFWTATEIDYDEGISRYLYYRHAELDRYINMKSGGSAVRLVRDSDSKPWLDMIQIAPLYETVCINDSLTFTCTAVFSDDSEKDVTLETDWTVYPGLAGQISPAGLFTAFDTSGVETITARYEDQEASWIIMIQDTTADTSGDITGTWQAVTETIDLSAYTMGEITVTPYSYLFQNIVMIMKPDGTFEYDTWTGADIYTAHDVGTGNWTVAGTAVFLAFDGYNSDDLSGTCRFLDENRVQFSTVISTGIFGGGSMTVPVTLIMERVPE
jgi:uncharacterized protein (TIGR02145 family)